MATEQTYIMIKCVELKCWKLAFYNKFGDHGGLIVTSFSLTSATGLMASSVDSSPLSSLGERIHTAHLFAKYRTDRAWIFDSFEQRGYKLVAMKMTTASKEHLEKHYSDLSSKGFFKGLVAYMASGPVVAMVWEGMPTQFCLIYDNSLLNFPYL